MNAISESLVVFRGAAPQATRREILLGSRDQLGSLLLYQLPCCIVTSLSEFLESSSQVQFKVLVITFETLHGTGLGHLRDCLSLITLTQPFWSSRRGVWRYHQLWNFVGWDLARKPFLTPTL